MNFFLRAISFIFHPILMPILGVSFYFSKAPRYIPNSVIIAKLTSISILTIILPILLYFLLKITYKVDSIYLENVNHRVIPLLLNTIIVVLILLRVISAKDFFELYYFFIGILISNLTCLALVLFKYKVSLHMIGLGCILMFYIALSIHFKINVIGSLALLFLITGIVATSRLHLHKHTKAEVLIGFLIGFLPQLILLKYWL